MKYHRILTLSLIVVTALGIFILPTTAQSPADLNALAQYFPAETPILISVRTDDAFIATLNDVIERVRTVIPDSGDETLNGALDKLTEEFFPDGTFEEDMRPLLGDTATIGITSTQGMVRRGDIDSDDAPTIVALSIRDRAALVEAIINAAEENITATEEDGYTVLAPALPDEDDVAMIVRDDVLLLYANTDTSAALATGGVLDGSLGSSADFTASLGLLPEPVYNVTVYIDLVPLIEASAASDPEAAEALGAMGGLFNALGKQVWGFTVLGGDSLVMDIASQITDLSAFEELGLTVGSTAPVDPAFAAHIPANVPFAIFGTDLKTSLSASSGSLNFMLQSNQMADSDFNPKDVEAAIKQINQAFTQYTGLDFEQDVLSWLTGDYALFLGFNPQFDASSQFGLFQAFPVDFGFAIDASDAAQAQATVAGLTQAFEKLIAEMGDNSGVETDVAITTEPIGGADVTVVTITAENTPWPVELLMGANDDVFAFGTRGAVRAVLAPDGGLPTNAEYARATPHILPDAVSVAWLNTNGLLPLADMVSTFSQNDDADEQADEARAAINLFSSGTISAKFDAESGVSLARFVLTFSEQ